VVEVAEALVDVIVVEVVVLMATGEELDAIVVEVFATAMVEVVATEDEAGADPGTH
jgi:hypothetical protein